MLAAEEEQRKKEIAARMKRLANVKVTTPGGLVISKDSKIDILPNLEVLKGDAGTAEKLAALVELEQILDACNSSSLRGLNKGAEFCNSVLQHDGLNTFQMNQSHEDPTIAKKSEAMIARIVPMIW